MDANQSNNDVGDSAGSRKSPSENRRSTDKDMQRLPDNTLHYSSRHAYRSGLGPPRNMDELSDLIFGMREDIYTL